MTSFCTGALLTLSIEHSIRTDVHAEKRLLNPAKISTTLTKGKQNSNCRRRAIATIAKLAQDRETTRKNKEHDGLLNTATTCTTLTDIKQTRNEAARPAQPFQSWRKIAKLRKYRRNTKLTREAQLPN